MTATDADWSEEYGSVYYWISSGNTDRHFFINQLNGSVYLADNVDYETQTNYNLTVSIVLRPRFLESH